jgi:pimeloyl-ACP methyl ester carboxylesterase
MADHSEDWRLELLDGIGHFILDEAPEQVERLARPFLAR